MAFDWNQYTTDQGFDEMGRQRTPSPYGTQPGSQDTGIAGPGLGTLGSTPTQNFDPSMGTPAGGVQAGANGAFQPGGAWDQAYFTQNFGSPGTPQELEALTAKIEAAGGKVIKNAAGVAGKIQTPDGRVIDIINSAGAGGRGFQWLEGGGGGGGGLGTSPLAGLGYNFGDAMGKFTAPTAAEALASPGMEFALSEAHRMGANNGAARGVFGNGRFQQALNASDIQNALGGYQGVYDRAFQTFTRNQDAPFSKQYQLATLGKPT